MGMRYVKKDDTKKEGTDMQSIKIYVTVSEISMIVQELLLLGRWDDRLIDQASDLFFFFIISCKNLCKNPFKLHIFL